MSNKQKHNTMRIIFYNYKINFSVNGAMSQDVYESAISEAMAKEKALVSIRGAYGSDISKDVVINSVKSISRSFCYNV